MILGRSEFKSSQPYDIYAQSERESSGLMGVLESPWVWVPSLMTDLLVAPALTNPKTLRKMMGKADYGQAMRDARMYYGTSGRSAAAAGRDTSRFLRSAPRSELGFQGGRGGWFSEQRAFRRHLHTSFGAKAGARINLARGIHGLSRAIGAYFLLDLGVSAIEGINDLVNGYTPSDPKVPGHRDIETGGQYVDTRAAQTQRARALQAIHNTQLSTRAALSNEASFMHFNR